MKPFRAAKQKRKKKRRKKSFRWQDGGAAAQMKWRHYLRLSDGKIGAAERIWFWSVLLLDLAWAHLICSFTDKGTYLYGGWSESFGVRFWTRGKAVFYCSEKWGFYTRGLYFLKWNEKVQHFYWAILLSTIRTTCSQIPDWFGRMGHSEWWTGFLLLFVFQSVLKQSSVFNRFMLWLIWHERGFFFPRKC